MSEVLQCATQKLKTGSFFNPAGPVLQTGLAVLHGNSHISGAILLGVDRLSSHRSSGLGKYRYHVIWLSSFVLIFSYYLCSLDLSGYIMETCG
jgi:hypothetical protein